MTCWWLDACPLIRWWSCCLRSAIYCRLPVARCHHGRPTSERSRIVFRQVPPIGVSPWYLAPSKFNLATMPGCGFHGRTHVTGADGSIPLYGCPFSPTGSGAITSAPPEHGRPRCASETVTYGCADEYDEPNARVLGACRVTWSSRGCSPRARPATLGCRSCNQWP